LKKSDSSRSSLSARAALRRPRASSGTRPPGSAALLQGHNGTLRRSLANFESAPLTPRLAFACASSTTQSMRCSRRVICSRNWSISCSRYFSRPRTRVYPASRTRPRASTVRIAVRPTKRAAPPRPPRVDLPAERAVGVAEKKPTAKPVVAPRAAPKRNFAEPSPTRKALLLASALAPRLIGPV